MARLTPMLLPLGFMQEDPDEKQAFAVGLPTRTTGAAIGAFRTDLMDEALLETPAIIMQKRLQDTLIECGLNYIKLRSQPNPNQQDLIDQEIEMQTIQRQLLVVSRLAQ